MVHLSDEDRGRCEFPNVHAVVLDINEAGMYKLGNTQGALLGVYSRNQFELESLLSKDQVNKDTGIPLQQKVPGWWPGLY